jgi:nucleoside-diphosphate-sugar epimerase
MPEIHALANPDPADARLIFGCGYLGRRVAARWLAQGRRVFATTRARFDQLSELGIAPIAADVLVPDSLRSLPACATTIYCIGFDRSSGRSMRDVYVQGLANVLAALPRPGRFIYVSSTGVYGDADGNWVDETTPPDPADESGRVVRDAEELLRQARPDAIILRFAGIYGPRRLLRRVESLLSGEPIAADPDKWLNLIHVEDGAAAVLAAEELGHAGEVYNVADGAPVRRREFFTELAALVGAPAPTFESEWSNRERGNRRVLVGKMQRELQVQFQFPDYLQGLRASLE